MSITGSSFKVTHEDDPYSIVDKINDVLKANHINVVITDDEGEHDGFVVFHVWFTKP